MPNVTIYIPRGRMPSDARLAELSRDCIKLCTSVLEAALENVHVIYVEVRHGHGHPVFAEVQYRVETFRTPAVMNPFMKGLDEAIERCTGLTARIRCFGYAASNIHARN
ncbi:4-oxalocrotonate tautomerase family protein [Pandoraea sp.]|uniref:tautomerase family protein n=1 Tax=Pandoraea sp. TaxID=1883445 RepID=UPI0035B0C6F5